MASKSKNHTSAKRTAYWLPATGFYFLVFGVSAATFFLIILIFHDGGQDIEFVSAGLAASAVLIGGVVLREVILRGVREKHAAKRRMLDRNILAVATASGEYSTAKKVTLEQLRVAIETIKSKSEAAKVFNRIAAGHKEVFELCEEYSRIVAKELPNTHPDSPRLKSMVRGRRIAAELHEFHMLRWAEIESKGFADRAAGSSAYSEKIDLQGQAQGVIAFALGHYPDNERLLDSARYLAGEANNSGLPTGVEDIGTI